jgi:hypothetical protein
MLSTLLILLAASTNLPDPKLALAKSCAPCHRSANAPAGLDFTALTTNLNDPETYSRWLRVHDAIERGAMPPTPLPKPERDAFLAAISNTLTTHDQARAKQSGRATLRRLNRYEYENTLRDLLHAPYLQLKDSLPEDGILARFNKSGQALDVSHVQMSRYLETAEDALRLVLDSSRATPIRQRFYAREQKSFQHRMRYSPFNSHPERAFIPILGTTAQPNVLHEKVPFTVGPSQPDIREREAFVTPAGNYVGNEHRFDSFTAPAAGKYRLRFYAYSIWIHTIYTENRGKNFGHWRPNRELTSRGRTTEPVTLYALKRGEKRHLATFDVTPDDAPHEVEVDLLPGETIAPDPARLFRSRPGFRGSPDATAEGMPGVAYRAMDVEGPLPNPAQQRALNAYFSNANSVNAFLASAYRRPPTAAEQSRYRAIFNQARQAPNAKLEDALITTYTAILCSPAFLYLEETPGPLPASALASRLSYLLWNSAPDSALRQTAATNPKAQAIRLLNHPNSANFINAFLDYWLDLRKLGDNTPDQILYPDYYLDDLLTQSARAETRLFFTHLLQNNLPARNLIQANFTYLNSHLARHYNIPGIEGVHLRPVHLPAGSPRGGLLTQAAILNITANGTTTSPVLRGVWINERILGDTPPPPPPGTPAVEPDTRGAVTIREQLDKHRAVKSCATCHLKIDPPGFALESFDVFGAHRDRYRSTESGTPVPGLGKNGHDFAFKLGLPVDSSGQLPTGQRFANIHEYKQLLAANDRTLARNLVHQFIAYATGTPVRFADRPEVERILNATQASQYGVRDLLLEVIQSKLFREK